jgi:hypothetical protein
VRVTSGASVIHSQTAVVKVIPAILVITGEPMDANIYTHDYFVFYVSASGSNISYQWYNGNSGDITSPVVGATTSYFIPPNSTVGTFAYWCRAISGSVHRDTRTALLTVIGRKPFITTQPGDTQLTQGSGDVSVAATLDDSNGASWQWYQGESGDTTSPLSGKTGASMILSNVAAGTYNYWVRVTNPYGFTDSRTASVIVSPASFAHWLAQNNLPVNGSGLGAMGASPYGDGVSNLLKYAMGVRAVDRFDDEHGPRYRIQTLGGQDYLTIEFTQSQTASGAQLVVEESGSLTNWSTSAVECGPSYSRGDGTMTRTFRVSQPMNSRSAGYLRLKAASN